VHLLHGHSSEHFDCGSADQQHICDFNKKKKLGLAIVKNMHIGTTLTHTTHAHAHTYTYTSTHIRTQAHTYTSTHTHTHTHTHTYTQAHIVQFEELEVK